MVQESAETGRQQQETENLNDEQLKAAQDVGKTALEKTDDVDDLIRRN